MERQTSAETHAEIGAGPGEAWRRRGPDQTIMEPGDFVMYGLIRMDRRSPDIKEKMSGQAENHPLLGPVHVALRQSDIG
ncbi:hypothetical protein LMG27198_27620 [Methylocystis echinoides]|uniref:Uncharacterized protein n=1 Tax=Methylocystis echinoides TaxID=29468 RepID=A0A9W6LSK2_9HYPH|nr:hypothetical protein LMG27198_27620 [Methylocystis echinoides]